MSRQVRPRSTLTENFKLVRQIVPWRLFLLLPFLLVFAVPAFLLGTGAGHHLLPNLTTFFYNLANPSVVADPTPQPAYSQLLPQPGSILYTVQSSDSCDEILASQMHMSDAGQIFADSRPVTVQALNASLEQNCANLQPGEQVLLMPQYPLVSLGGQILKVAALSPAQPIPTPLIPVQRQQQVGVDCSNGCLLTVRVSNAVQVKLSVQTAIPVPVGAWIWAQAMYPRKAIAGFDTYPYADSATSNINGATLRVCDVQINATHDDNSLGCDQLIPNTIDDDGGAWLLGVTGSSGLDHWNYGFHLPAGTQVLVWLSINSHGDLRYRHNDPLYRYDSSLHRYVRV
ncbi:MAG TPA: hypothetical protein VGD98_10930 [Ktedonobacteraceae bacterium]